MNKRQDEYADYGYNAGAASNVPPTPPSSQFGMMMPNDDQPSGRGLQILRNEQSFIDKVRLRSQLAEGNRKVVDIRITAETEKVLIGSALEVAAARELADTQREIIRDRERARMVANRKTCDDGVYADIDRAIKEIEASDLSDALKERRIARLEAALKRYEAS